MGVLYWFDAFDPVNGVVTTYPFRHLPNIAGRARILLKPRSVGQIKSAANTVDWMIGELEQEIKGNDSDTFTQGTDKEPETIEETSNEVESLKQSLDLYNLSDDLAFPDGRNYEYFAVLSLGLLAEALHWLNWTSDPTEVENSLRAVLPLHPRPDEAEGQIPALIDSHQKGMDIARSLGMNDKSIAFSLAGERALLAMDAVCYAEHLQSVEKIHTQSAFDLARNLEEEKQAERKKRSINAQKLNIYRHAKDNAARAAVVTHWEKEPSRFPSAEKAGKYFADWLQGEGYSYEPRAVTDWIRMHARKIGVKLR